MNPASPDDIRANGWMVAVHNDYRLRGEFHTFWLFTKGDYAAKGEGKSDAEALEQVRAEITRIEAQGEDIPYDPFDAYARSRGK